MSNAIPTLSAPPSCRISVSASIHNNPHFCFDKKDRRPVGRRSVFLLLVPVVVDVLHVVVVLHHVDELFHVLDVPLVGEGNIVLGHHLHLGGGEHIALFLHGGRFSSSLGSGGVLRIAPAENTAVSNKGILFCIR